MLSCTGCAFVTFRDPEDAKAAMAGLSDKRQLADVRNFYLLWHAWRNSQKLPAVTLHLECNLSV